MQYHKYRKRNIGCAICFESVFPEASVDCVKAGAEVITVLTNDSWLGERLPFTSIILTQL